MKKAVFFDIDGTLWNEKNEIPQSAIDGIKKLQKNGHLAFLCSGRSKAFIRDKALLSIGFDGILAGCGTYMEDRNGKLLFYKRLDNELAKKTVTYLQKKKYTVVLEGKDNMYADADTFTNGANNAYYQKLKRELGVHLCSLSDNWGNWEISKMSASITGCSDADFKELVELFDADYNELLHGRQVAELVPKGFSKATGIQKACELYGIAREDTYAIGDSANDVEMLKFAGTGIAMGNGTQEAFAAADYVTDTLFEDGVYHALEHFGLL